MVQGKRHHELRLEVHDDRVGEEIISQEHNCNMVPVFFGRRTWTPTTSLSDLSTLFLGQEEVHVETVQAMRPTTLVLHVLLELQNEALFKLLAVRASERRRGRAPAPAPAW